jgi:hypothetical protein
MLSRLALNKKKASGRRQGHPKLDATQPAKDLGVQAIVMTFERYAPMRAQSFPLAEGDAGVSQTVRAIRQLIEHGKEDPRIHEPRRANAARGPRAGRISAGRRDSPPLEPSTIGEWPTVTASVTRWDISRPLCQGAYRFNVDPRLRRPPMCPTRLQSTTNKQLWYGRI